jgi:hypothetical protein
MAINALFDGSTSQLHKKRIKTPVNAMNNIIIDTRTAEKLIIICTVHLFEIVDSVVMLIFVYSIVILINIKTKLNKIIFTRKYS